MNTTQPRILLPYEKNELAKHGIPQETALASNAPVEYLTGHVTFCGLDFLIDESALIPRVETEELVELATKTAQKLFEQLNRKLILFDIGTGSGAISLALSHKLHNLQIPHHITALDISPEALALAQKNAKQLNLETTITVTLGDLLSNQTTAFDLLIANLPYIPTHRIATLDASVKDFEPHLALDGGSDGLDLIKRLLLQARKRALPHSRVLLEVDHTHQEFFNAFTDSNKTDSNKNADWQSKVILDSMGTVPFIVLQPL